MEFTRAYSKAPWEKQIGYCRALRAGNQIVVTGTAPIDDQGDVFAPGDAYRQAQRCLEIVDSALAELGASRTSIIRTRMFVTDMTLWEQFGRAHREFFGEDRPTTSIVEVSRLIKSAMLIEIEADAYVE